MYVEAKIDIWSRLPENLENKHVIFLIHFLLKSIDFEPPINCSWGNPHKSLAQPFNPPRKTINPPLRQEATYTKIMGPASDM